MEALIRPVVESSGLELVEVARNRGLLRVVVDREGGVDLDAIAQTSEKLSRRLDLEDFGQGSYTLEVSSPGVERHLREPREFIRRVGERVKVKCEDPEEGPMVLEGTLAGADEDAVTIEGSFGERRVTYPLIRSARTMFEWGPGPKPGKQKTKAGGARGESPPHDALAGGEPRADPSIGRGNKR